MKLDILVIPVLLLLFAGCARMEEGIDGEKLQQVTFGAVIDGTMVTKALADNDGKGANVNRCVMEVYYESILVSREYSTVSDGKAVITTRLVPDKTYTVAFWADHVADSGTADGLAEDLYYCTDSVNGLQYVTFKGNYAGNCDSRDAFCFSDVYTVTADSSSFTGIRLTRPFAQINVITTSLSTIHQAQTQDAVTTVSVTVKDAYKTYNVVTGSPIGEKTNISYTGVPLYNVPSSVSGTVEATLSMDYLFVSDTQQNVNIDWTAVQPGGTSVNQSFAGVPCLRNYRTNIKGEFLSEATK